MLYVHGFGTWQHEALTHAANSFARSQSRISWVVFCWPSKGSGLSSPSTRAILTNGYWVDSTAAAASTPAFVSTLYAVLDAVGGAHAIVVAHSRGAQIASDALTKDETLRARLAADRLLTSGFRDLIQTTNSSGSMPTARPRSHLRCAGRIRTARTRWPAW